MENLTSGLPTILISAIVSLVVTYLTNIWISHHNNKYFDEYHKNEKESHILERAPSIRKIVYAEYRTAEVISTRILRAAVEVSAAVDDPTSLEAFKKRHKSFKLFFGKISNVDMAASSQWIVVIVNNQSNNGIKIDSISTVDDDRLPISASNCFMVDTQETVSCFFPYRDSPTAIYATYQGLRIVYPLSEDSEFSTPHKAE